MNHCCPICREEFCPASNPTVMLANDQEGQAVWLPVCRDCADELEVTALATEHQ